MYQLNNNSNNKEDEIMSVFKTNFLFTNQQKETQTKSLPIKINQNQNQNQTQTQTQNQTQTIVNNIDSIDHQSLFIHNCTRCPSNMCKGLITRQFLSQRNYDRCIYIGDGSGDFCACINLRGSQDLIFCRKDYPLMNKIQQNDNLISAQVFYWANAAELLQLFHINCLN
eukprot:TRINITY_DN948_c0_g3_i2.p1 TRINITY_DN948_c0_g3~~TRINITY_DN948_c0_g3_i2.p1  ORF type:complete len:169 (-),score=54.34 TRINITY_DN948_c0_g3_i2:90-596(-)